MAELKQETNYVTHHIQKVVAFFTSMRSFSEFLTDQGHSVTYLKINDANNPHDLKELILRHVEITAAEKFEYLLPDEYRLDQQLQEIASILSIRVESFDTQHFFTNRDTLEEFFKGKKQLIMEPFYRMMRKEHNIMMNNGEPEGGKWNYDQSNRKKWKGNPSIPPIFNLKKDVSSLYQEIQQAGIKTIGTSRPVFFQLAH